MRKLTLVTVVVLGLGLTALGPVQQASAASGESPTVYVGQLDIRQLKTLLASGLDREDITASAAAQGKVKVEVVLGRAQAAKLTAGGLALSEKQVAGQSASKRMAAQAASGYTVFRSYSEKGGLKDEYTAIAKKYPGLTKLQVIGRTVNGQDIIALKLTKDATKVKDGSRPSVLYSSAQHAREWITPEMNRRLLHHLIDRYPTDPKIKKLIDGTELWFVPVANPDGYDYTFTQDHRLWRKNLRDNNGDGQITGLDGVDPNRNYPTKWGYDNEGSSPNTASETYRGPSPASEPETRAMTGLMSRIGFEFQINYHSAAELLLYGVGWQVATPTPDDLLYEALAGDDAKPSVPGYDPDISAELYTTNGETTEHAQNAYGTLAFTPEMSTCQTASAADPSDAFEADDCLSVFNFPDSEALVQAEFQKNIPFALAVADSAKDPSHPVSVVGRTAPDLVADAFTTSYGNPQTVAVTARRSLRDKELHYRINGGREQTADVREWKGGERYGGTNDVYYAEYRGTVTGTRKGDKVQVWFTGKDDRKTSKSQAFTYSVARTEKAAVLVLANEDYEGVNPTYPASVTAPKYAKTYTDALKSKGISSAVWDVSAQGVPHDLGVLGHFDAVVWYLGDNRLTQDPADEFIDYGGEEVDDLAVAERQQYLTIAVRDYLNDGGKLVHTGETAAYYGQLSGLGGIYYGLNGDPSAECVVTDDPFGDCLLLADDFSQYYLGAYSRAPLAGPTSFSGLNRLAGTTAAFGGPALADNPLNEAGAFGITSDNLPQSQFPQFASTSAGLYRGASGGAYDPVEGSWYVGRSHLDDSYMRLARTVDLSGVTATQAPALQAQLSYDVEPGYDNVIVEAHTVGADDWTTLAESGGLSSTTVPAECEAGFLLEEHPFLEHYLTLGDPCTATGTTGAWNAMTGSSNGWQPASFSLSAFAGKQVEVVISYVSDSAFGGAGVFIDDTKVIVGSAATQAEGFETGLGAWAVAGPPAGSPTGGNFVRSQGQLFSAVSTKDSVLFGFGLEQIAGPAERATVLAKALNSIR